MYFDKKAAAIEQYLRKLSGHEKDPGGIMCDHNYVKPWSAHADSHRTKPAKMLFMNSVLRPKCSFTYPDEEIDVVNISSSENSTLSPFDSQKTKVVANELERSLKCNMNNDDDGSELEDFPLENCSPQKRKIYREVMEVVKADVLAKIAYSGQANEFIKRKILTERCARQLRSIFANTFYDFDDLIFWIHKLILDKGDTLTISSYLNILQALRTKLPSIVDKILKSYSGRFHYEYLYQILKKQWDPTIPVLNQHRLKKLPGNPLLIMSGAGFNLAKAANESPRFRFWTNHLNALCKTMYIPMNCDVGFSVEEALEDTMFALGSKITEFKNHFPNRPVIVAGWTIGALIACLVGLETAVDAILCFGFPLTGVNGSRGDLNDPLLENTVPTLFIVGQNSNMCSTDDIEDFRSRMRAESGLVIVGGADDLLRVSPQKLLQESITQEIVDRCILDEISDFLQASLVKLPTANSLLSNNATKSCPTILEGDESDAISHEEEGKRKRRRTKQYSTELKSSRKRAKRSTPKKIPDVSAKSRLSPSSSETSSSGCYKNVKQNVPKIAKKNIEKRGVGRPPSGAGRKRGPAKESCNSVPEISKEVPKTTYKSVLSAPIILPAFKKQVTMPKSSLPFALNIIPKKNDPVDVEKAFGNDRSYLPRPLTPPEPEDTISAEETEKVLAELESSSLVASGPSKCHNEAFIDPIPEIPIPIPITEKTFMPLTSSSSSSSSSSDKSSVAILTSKTMSGSIIKPNSITSSKKAPSSVTSTGFKTVFQQGKVLNRGPVAHMKDISGVNLVASSLSQSKAFNTTKTITVPSNTILVSSQTVKTPSGKILKLLSKGPISLKAKETLASSKLVGANHKVCERQSGNLSLLSDIAGPTKPLINSAKKLDTATPSATLVKLAVPDKSTNLKHFHILKGLNPRSTPGRIETTEEIVEKKLAIQALNKSVQMETTALAPVKESGYSICYAKPDGSIISRAVPKPGPATYIRQSIITQPPGRGRVRPILPSKTYQFYHK